MLIVKLRSKISFSAFLKGQTISELFATQILNSYLRLSQDEQILHLYPTQKVQDCYEEIIAGELQECFKVLMKLNIEQGQVVSDFLERKLEAELLAMVTGRERLAIKKPGIRAVKDKVIDPQLMANKGRKLAQVFNKNKCWDIFQEAKLDNGVRLYEAKPVKKKYRYKFDRTNKMELYHKLKLLLSLQAVRGELFIQVFLRCIKLRKEVFMLDIEEGREVFIPRELAQDGLPWSFRYYDPILRLT